MHWKWVVYLTRCWLTSLTRVHAQQLVSRAGPVPQEALQSSNSFAGSQARELCDAVFKRKNVESPLDGLKDHPHVAHRYCNRYLIPCYLSECPMELMRCNSAPKFVHLLFPNLTKFFTIETQLHLCAEGDCIISCDIILLTCVKSFHSLSAFLHNGGERSLWWTTANPFIWKSDTMG